MNAPIWTALTAYPTRRWIDALALCSMRPGAHERHPVVVSPARLPSTLTVLNVYGSLFFAGARR